MDQIPGILEKLQDELVKSTNLLTKAKSPEERKVHADVIMALTKSVESLTNTMCNINEVFGGLDEEDFMFFEANGEDEESPF